MRKIYVTMTSWKKRIHHVLDTIYYMQNQSLKPDKFYLVLSEDEFPDKKIPWELGILNTVLIDILWVKENTKAFKKLIPVLYRHKDEDCWIITIDDDVVYDNSFIQTIVQNAEKYYGKIINPGICGNWIHGFAAIYHPSYFEGTNIFDLTTKEMIEMIEDDRYYNSILKQDQISCSDVGKTLTLMEYEEPLGDLYKGKR